MIIKRFFFIFIFVVFISSVKNVEKKQKLKKNVVDMSDAEIEKLYEEWEV